MENQQIKKNHGIKRSSAQIFVLLIVKFRSQMWNVLLNRLNVHRNKPILEVLNTFFLLRFEGREGGGVDRKMAYNPIKEHTYLRRTIIRFGNT